LSSKKVTRTEERELRRYRQFYQTYPQIREAVSPELQQRLLDPLGTKKFEKRESPTPELAFPAKELIAILSFSHFVELLKFEDPVQRAFYEIECIKGNWSVRELKRQIGSLYYERSSLSRNKKKLSEMVRQDTQAGNFNITVRDPYVFEFLGLKSEEVMSESHLEDQLLNKLQEFLLELGHGFCFEARQKRILIGDEHFFVDLVFYHRILKCHVLVELKLEKFNHQNIGQLNTYVSWYRKNMMTEDDNPPVGILLCTGKNQTLVDYAFAGIDNQLFVSKYMLELPKKEDMQRFIEQQIQESKKE
jgi:predicted nuclease of restriction endonuclease-like (RecB) superfamily